MGLKTRYLQLSLTTMLEYNIDSEDKESFTGNVFKFNMTKLRDGHYSLFSPCSYEVKKMENGVYAKLPANSFTTINTFNHYAVPTDNKDTEWYTFLDPDFKYNSEGNIESLEAEDPKVKSYLNYCTNPSTGERGFMYGELDGSEAPGWDNARLYFSSGYDFSDVFGTMLRLYVERNDGSFLDLCNVFFTRSNVYKYIQFLTKPIIFGSVIYDRYLDIKVIATNNLDDCPAFKELLNIKQGAPIKMMFSYIENNTKEISNLEYSAKELFYSAEDLIYENVSCYFTRSGSIKGTIPTERLNSDNLGVYISSVSNEPYIEFYGTWKDKPLDTPTVHTFNVDIPLYDQRLVKRGEVTYEVDTDYTPKYNMKKWVAQHEIQCDIVNTDLEIIKSETYTQSQVFIGDENEQLKFYYRPIVFDDYTTLNIAQGDVAMVINYTLRFMNIEDGVQIVKNGSLSLSGNDLFKFCGKTTSLGFSDRLPYKVYNKIVEQKQVISNNASQSSLKTKFIKTFYNATNIFLDYNGVATGNGNFTLALSQAPRNYKFVFKQEDINGNMNYLDMTDAYYKLFARDINKKEIVIEPTYSNNMNLALGELEFNISSSHLNKLKAVPAEDRRISIVVYNADNSVSSMYDMKYTFN